MDEFRTLKFSTEMLIFGGIQKTPVEYKNARICRISARLEFSTEMTGFIEI